jgi:alpha-mannosidase
MNKIHLIGNAHLDPVWLWRWQDGCNEVMQTFRSALDRLKEYDFFVFTCSSARYYKWVEENDPVMFAEIQDAVKQGRWIIVNGWWVQPDCNIPSGESFARQALYSQTYYYEKFGKICKTAYNVDSFGHNGNLPQIIRKSGMTNYVMMRPSVHENSEMPKDVFWWDGIDGTRILTYRILNCNYAVNGKENLDKTIKFYDEYVENLNHDMMLFYGVGNHGGGPTRADIEHLNSILHREGKPELEFSNPEKFFSEVLLDGADLPVWSDDLQHHASGCYSATSMIKQQNRRVENLLYGAEVFDTIASKFYGSDTEKEQLKEAWEKVSFNQFHDIMCGCSIMEAYEDARDSFGYASTVAQNVMNKATIKIARNIDTWVDGVSEPYSEVRHNSGHPEFAKPVVVFNPLSYDVSVPVRVYQKSRNVKDSEGNFILHQNIRSSRSNDSHQDTLFIADIPAFGYNTYWVDGSDETAKEITSEIKTENLTIENSFIKASFDKNSGGIIELVDKISGHEYCKGKIFAVPTIIDDHETDTWAHNVFTFHNIKDTMNCESVEIIEQGPVRAVIRCKFAYNKSTLVIDYILASGQKTLRAKCKAIWHEDFTILKMPFDIGGSDAINTYAIPAGFIKRPTNGEEEPAGRYGDITATVDGKRVGLAIVNDAKYSYDCIDTELRLTCLRNVIFADHYSDRPPANFNFTDEGLQRFEFGIYLHEGECENSDVEYESQIFNIRPTVVLESFHKGNLPQKQGVINIDKDNVCVTALKYAEDNSGDLILRMYETKGKNITRVAVVSDIFDFGFYTDIHAHEYKTFRIGKDSRVLDTNFLEGLT